MTLECNDTVVAPVGAGPISSTASAPIEHPQSKSSSKELYARRVTMGNSQSKTIYLSHSDSDDDDTCFRKGSVFDHNFVSKKPSNPKLSKQQQQVNHRPKPINNPSNGEKSAQGNKQNAIFPDLLMSANVTPKRKVEEEIDLISVPDSASRVSNSLEASDCNSPKQAKSAKITPSEKCKQEVHKKDTKQENHDMQAIDLTYSPRDQTFKPNIPLSSAGVFVKEERLSMPILEEKSSNAKQNGILNSQPICLSDSDDSDDEDFSNNRVSVFSENYKPSKLITKVKREVEEEKLKQELEMKKHKDETSDPTLNGTSGEGNSNQSEEETPRTSLKKKKNLFRKKSFVAKPPPRLTPEELKKERARHLNEISDSADKALQLMLWDIGFMYNILPHQFKAARFVAGLELRFPFSDKTNPSMAEDCPEGANHRRSALKRAAKEFIHRQANKEPPKDGYFDTLATKGMLLADEMGLGTIVLCADN